MSTEGAAATKRRRTSRLLRPNERKANVPHLRVEGTIMHEDVGKQSKESTISWNRATADWHQKRFDEIRKHMRQQQLCGRCDYPKDSAELCDTQCDRCEYFHLSTTRMKHISELINECMTDLAAKSGSSF